MTNEQYQTTQDVMAGLYQQLSLYNLDLDEFLSRLRRADAFGPIVDPTLWIQARDKLETIKRMAEALLPAVRLVKELREELLRGQA